MSRQLYVKRCGGFSCDATTYSRESPEGTDNAGPPGTDDEVVVILGRSGYFDTTKGHTTMHSLTIDAADPRYYLAEAKRCGISTGTCVQNLQIYGGSRRPRMTVASAPRSDAVNGNRETRRAIERKH